LRKFDNNLQWLRSNDREKTVGNFVLSFVTVSICYLEETESSEKDLGKLQNGSKPLDEEQWSEIYSALRPYLRPFSNRKDGRLHFYHRAFGKAVRTRSGWTSFISVTHTIQVVFMVQITYQINLRNILRDHVKLGSKLSCNNVTRTWKL